MLKKTITYVDFNGTQVSEEHFFHLSKADLVELEMSHEGGMGKWLENIIKSNDGAAIVAEFKKLLLMSYGKKSDDGKRFIRNQEMKDEFLSSEAYSTLFLELVTDAGAAAKFVNGIVPSGLSEDVEKFTAKDEENKAVAKPGPRVLSREEVLAMDMPELSHLLATGEAVIGE